MLRRLHSLPGLIFGLVLIVLASSGALLSLAPVMDRVQAPAVAGLNVAEVAARAAEANPGLTKLHRSPNGTISASVKAKLGFQTVIIDPATGKAIGATSTGGFLDWVKELHRSFFADMAGHAVSGISAGFMVLIAASGLFLLAMAMGGLRRITRRVRSTGSRGWHARVARLAAAGLFVSALTGSYMSLATFGVLNDGRAIEASFPDKVAEGTALPVNQLAALQAIPLQNLRDLTFPAKGDPTDAFLVSTATGEGYVDQVSGKMLNWMDYGLARRVWEFIYMLHTGQGLWMIGLVLGLSALSVPVLSVTGAAIWWGRRRARPHLRHNARASVADLVILVGSEGGTTWGFAGSLLDALHKHGLKVHVAAMNDLQHYPQAGGMILMTATYGDGEAPSSASRFIDKLAQSQQRLPIALLAFGDRMFPAYCGYAEKLGRVLEEGGWQAFLPFARVDRQSNADFNAWVQELGNLLSLKLEPEHHANIPPTTELELISREDYGAQVQAPTAILRFKAVRKPGWRGYLTQGLRYQAGDLLGIVAPGSDLPRLYSLASSRRDGFIEIAVRKMPGGLCSGWLNDMEPGTRIKAFVRLNPAFRPQAKGPVIMIAAGTGVGPMVGFLRTLRRGRQAVLYFGARDPISDFLYEGYLRDCLLEGRLARLVPAFSRVRDRAYVQGRVRHDAAHLRDQILRGGQVLVCGSIAMARAVADEVEAALAPIGLSVAGLRAEGRYLEDVY
ncbi:nitric oxide synthase [bacterium]|nr:nitric oxide synthase [bacterium]